MKALYLSNWSDIIETRNENQDYLDYEALINSDDEYLCLSSIYASNEVDYDSMLECSNELLFLDGVSYDSLCY